MRARLASPRRRGTARGRLIVPVAAAAAVALVGGVVVATPDTPVAREDVKTVASSAVTAETGGQFNIDVTGPVASTGSSAATVTGITGLPAGLTYDSATGKITGKVEKEGTSHATVQASVNAGSAQLPVTIPLDITGIPNNHLSYAVQWFSFAVICFGMTMALAWRIRRRTI